MLASGTLLRSMRSLSLTQKCTFHSYNGRSVILGLGNLHRPSHRTRSIAPPIRRHYWYLPTSWTEFKYRMQTITQTRKIKVRIFQQDAALRWSLAVQRYKNRKQRMRHRKERFQEKLRVRMKTMWRKKSVWVSKSLPEYSEENWFDLAGRPLTSRDPTGRFVNPWMAQSTDGVQSLWRILQWRWERTRRYWRELTQRGGFLSLMPPPQPHGTAATTTTSTTIPSPNIPATAYAEFSHVMPSPEPIQDTFDEENAIKVTWIGHATCLLQQDGMNLLLDPMFSTRASPFRHVVGIARSVPPSHSLNELPENIDICLISHDHYDHLDKETCLQLRDRVQQWVVPLGLAEWLQDRCGIPRDRIIELEWWESVHLHKHRHAPPTRVDAPRHGPLPHQDTDTWELRQRHFPRDSNSLHPAILRPPAKGSVWITCLPAQHWSSRTFFDRNYRLWSSLAIVGEAGTVYYAGDTALPKDFPLFEQIRDYLGSPVDLSLLPIGAYEPDFFMLDAHMHPGQALRVHQILRSRQSIGVHWGTFCLSEEPLTEPPLLLRHAIQEIEDDDRTTRGKDESVIHFTTLRIGESMRVSTRVSEPPDDDDDDDDDDGYYDYGSDDEEGTHP